MTIIKIPKIFLIQRKAQRGNAKAQYQLATYYFEKAIPPKPQDFRVFFMDGRPPMEPHICATRLDNQDLDTFTDYMTNYDPGQRYRNLGNAKPNDSDLKKASYWYKKAAKQGYKQAFYPLGLCYSYGLGRDMDKAKGMMWYAKAAKHDEEQACIQQGFGYLYGEGVPVDLQQALVCFQQASEAEKAHGQFLIGVCYHYGVGIDRNTAQARAYFTKAAEQEHDSAKDYLDDFYDQIPQCYCYRPHYAV